MNESKIFFIMKLFFRFTTFCFSIADKYRVRYYEYIYSNKMHIHPSVKMGRCSSINIPFSAKLVKLYIDKNTRFRKFCTITIDANGRLSIGENTFFNNGCSINCLGEISIGSNTLFGEGIRIYDHNHIFNKSSDIIENQGFKVGKVLIGNNCWIGSNCIILNNVNIGDNVVIGAGCVVSFSVPSNTIVRTSQHFDVSPIIFR